MAVVKQDTFVDTANVQLQNHIPTPSGTGGWDTDTDPRLEIGAANDLRIDSETSHKFGRETTSIGDDDMDVSLDVQLNNASANQHKCGPSGRIPNTENGSANGYHLWLVSKGTGGDLELVKRVASVETSLGTNSFGGSVATPFTLKLEIRAGAKKGYIDGVEKISSSDDSLIGNTYAGVNGLRNAWRADNFLSESVDAPTPPAPAPAAVGRVKRRSLVGVGL